MVESIVAGFVDQITSPFLYVYNYNNNFRQLELKIMMLEDARDIVSDQVTMAERNVEAIRQNVKNWLKKVDFLIDEANILIEKKANNRCFKGFCPNLVTSYKNSKEALKMLETVTNHLQQEKSFEEVSFPTILEDIQLTYVSGYEAFESRMSTLNGVLKALEDTEADIIGVYGMAGIGKTTLVKEVVRQVRRDKLFDGVILVEVSENPNIKKIQDEIAHRLGLQFNVEAERATKLYARLKQKKILVILDNIQEDLNLEEVGIPSGVDRGRCKLLLTTRNRQVLERMGSKSFSIDVLKEKEARSLFNEVVGGVKETEELKSLANNIVEKCEGLPVAIVAIAKALRNKRHPSQWEEALRQLERPSSTNFMGELKTAYSWVELSYNYLKGEELKEFFLLCSLMGHDASIFDLIKYVISLDILQGIYTIAEARDRVYALIHELKNSCLLLDGHTSESFSMHNFVREVAISIANRDNHVFFVQNENMWKWPSQNKVNMYTKISIRDTHIYKLDEGMECPWLQLLFMNTKVGNSPVEIPENFFTGMPKLKVLDLTRMKLSNLRSSLHLANLQTLCLDYSKFGETANIGELKALKVLSMRHSNVEQLTEEIGQLTQLRLLDLSNCQLLKVIAPNVLSSLIELEELYMSGCSVLWEVKGLKRSNASLEELKSLSHLTTLEINTNDEKVLPKGLFSIKLERYNISIGDGSSTLSVSGDHGQSMLTQNSTSSILRTLKLKLNSTTFSEEFQLFKNVELLCLDEFQGIENVLYELDKDGFSQLKHLYVHNNPDFLYIVDSTKYVPHYPFLDFPMLESLILFNMINLEKICYGRLATKSFCNLQIIEVRSCDKLKSIFSLSIVRSLRQLQRINVGDCQNMERIFADEKEDSVNNNEVIHEIEFYELRFLTLNNLPRLESFYSEVKAPSTSQTRQKELSLFNKQVIFPNLDELELYRINSAKIWDGELSTSKYSSWENLTRLIVGDCEKLKSVFPSSRAKSLIQLQHFEIYNCRVLKEVIGKEEAEAVPRFIFPCLTFLKLKKLPELATFYPGRHTCELPMLKKLEVCDCDKVKIFTPTDPSFPEIKEEVQFDTSIVFSAETVFPCLEELKWSGKDNMMTWQGQFPENVSSKLKVLEVVIDESANIPLGILHRFSNLKELKLSGCSFNEMFLCGEDEKRTWTLPQIRSLKLSDLSEMKYMWKQDFKLDSVLQNLAVLEVEWCEKLIILLPSSASFKNLTILKVEFCDGLIHIMTSSTARSLVQLRKMIVRDCNMMTEIVGNDEDEARGEMIVFMHLKSLSLEYLESLTCFCSEDYTFSFPCLEDLVVYKCPKMKIFTGGDLTTPMLQKIKIRPSDEGFWKDDLNRTIQQLHNKKVNVQGFEDDFGQPSTLLSE